MSAPTPTLPSAAIAKIELWARQIFRAHRAQAEAAGLTANDLRQKGFEEALALLPSFDASQGQLTTYLYLGVRGAMQRMVNSQSAKTVRIEPDSVRLKPDSAGSYSGASQAPQLVSSIEVDANLLASSPETPLDALLAHRAGDKLSAALDASTEDARLLYKHTMDLGLDASEVPGRSRRLACELEWTERRLEKAKWALDIALATARASADLPAREKATPRSTPAAALAEAERLFAKKPLVVPTKPAPKPEKPAPVALGPGLRVRKAMAVRAVGGSGLAKGWVKL